MKLVDSLKGLFGDHKNHNDVVQSIDDDEMAVDLDNHFDLRL